jgi:ferric-dicitrate binding protein FerR (iron transport regulator)
VIEDLVKKYFDEDCSLEEKRRIYEYLIENPSALAEYFSEREWDAFVQNDQDLRKDEEEQVQAFYRKKRRIVVRKILRYAAVAIIFLFSSLLLFKNHAHDRDQLAQHIIPSADLIVRINTKPVTEKIVLPDSSVVDLSPGSKLSYLAHFEPSKRDISLEGSAIFEVNKNPQKPFTVFCKEVSTTALGTKFKVNNSIDGKIDVELLEGKIVVTRSNSNDNAEKYYLLAGKGISFDRLKNKFTKIYSLFDESKRANMASKSVPGSEQASVKMITRVTETPQSIQFDNEPLAKVFEYMATLYGVKIIYPTKFISRIHFIGTVHKNEDIGEILQDITSMNDLILTHDTATNIYMIRIPGDSDKDK